MDTVFKTTSLKIKELKDTLPMLLLERQLKIQPELQKRYDEHHRKHYLEDVRFHLSYLSESIAAKEPLLFDSYTSWMKTYFSNIPVSDEDIIINLELLRDILSEKLPKESAKITSEYINRGIQNYINQPPLLPSFITNNNPHSAIASDYLNFLKSGDKRSANDLILLAVRDGIPIKEIYLDVFEVTQKETGRLWQLSEISVAQEHFITAGTQLIMSQLYPYLFTNETKDKKIIVSCIEGELHELGARMVADLFEMEGWNSYYFGANIPQLSLLSAIRTYEPDIVAISATMTFNVNAVSELIEKIKMNVSNKKVKILVGGYPFIIAENLWKNIGADGFAANAIQAIKLADSIINQDE